MKPAPLPISLSRRGFPRRPISPRYLRRNSLSRLQSTGKGRSSIGTLTADYCRFWFYMLELGIADMPRKVLKIRPFFLHRIVCNFWLFAHYKVRFLNTHKINFHAPDTRFPISDFRFQIPNSRFPIPDSRICPIFEPFLTV